MASLHGAGFNDGAGPSRNATQSSISSTSKAHAHPLGDSVDPTTLPCISCVWKLAARPSHSCQLRQDSEGHCLQCTQATRRVDECLPVNPEARDAVADLVHISSLFIESPTFNSPFLNTDEILMAPQYQSLQKRWLAAGTRALEAIDGPYTLINWAKWWFEHSMAEKDVRGVNLAVVRLEEAIKRTPANDPRRQLIENTRLRCARDLRQASWHLDWVAGRLNRAFEMRAPLVDAATRLQDLMTMGRLSFQKYRGAKDFADLEQSIEAFGEAESMPGLDPLQRVEVLDKLSSCFVERQALGPGSSDDKATDLTVAIELRKEIMELEPRNFSNLIILADCFYLRLRYSSSTNSDDDLHDAFELAEQAKEIGTEDAFLTHWLSRLELRLSVARLKRGENTQNRREDLEGVIRLAGRALKLAAPSSEVEQEAVSFLIWALAIKDEFAKSDGDITHGDLPTIPVHSFDPMDPLSIARSRPTLEIPSSGSNNTVAHALRGLVASDLTGIDSQIQTLKELAKLRPDAGVMQKISQHYDERHARSLQMDDLNHAIDWITKALEASSDGSVTQGLVRSDLAVRLCLRFRINNTMDDIDESLRQIQAATAVLPQNHPQMVEVQLRRANCLLAKLGRSNSRSRGDTHLETVTIIADLRDQLWKLPRNHRRRPRMLYVLGDLTKESAKLLDGLDGPDQRSEFLLAIAHLEDALGYPWTEDNSNLAVAALADCYYNLFKLSSKEDLRQLSLAIEKMEQCIAMPGDEVHRAGHLRQLGKYYHEKFRKALPSQDDDYGRCVMHCWNAVTCEGSPSFQRSAGGFTAGLVLGMRKNWSTALQAMKAAAELMSLINTKISSRIDQQFILSRAQGWGADAAAVALEAGSSPGDALDLLEAVRGLIAAGILDVRRDGNLLRGLLKSDDDGMVDEFIEAQSAFDTLQSMVNLRSSNSDWVTHSRTFHEAELRLEVITKKFHDNPQTKSFFSPTAEETLKKNVGNATIVVVNVSIFRSDAFLIDQAHGVRVIRLDKLLFLDCEMIAKLHRRHLPELDPVLLRWLWVTIASPILEALGFGPRTEASGSPRIIWVLTHPISQMPIHAAGFHEDVTKTVMGRVISSYSTSVRSFVRAKELHSATGNAVSRYVPRTALLVSAGDFPSGSVQRNLPFAKIEVLALELLCKRMGLGVAEMKDPKRQEVLAQLQTCTLFHFAGHGRSDGFDPSDSGLVLYDGFLTVEDLRNSNLWANKPFLAYLSACWTGASDVEQLQDEGVHLISGHQLAGFRHVVGTLWQVQDELCVKIAETVYQRIYLADFSDSSVSAGLHEALLTARKDWVDSMETKYSTKAKAALFGRSLDGEEQDLVERAKATLKLGGNKRPSSVLVQAEWVPYVHFGP